MSNGDDVLDNWEEIDEVGLQSSGNNFTTSSASTTTCERITKDCYQHSSLTLSTSALNSSLTRPTQMKLLQRPTIQESTSSSASKSSVKSPLDDMSSTFQPVMMVLHQPQDEYQSANYTAPIANQTVKILRRPTQSTEPRNNGIRPKQPIKTLKQREQEYAEARLRILGSAKNPEDEQKANVAITSITTSTTSTTNTTPSTSTVTAASLSNNSITNTLAAQKTNSPKTQVGVNQYNNHFNQPLQQQYQNYQSQQQNYFYNQQQQQQPPQPPAYINNRPYNTNPLLGLGPMGAIGQPAQYQATTLSSPQTHLKYQQYHQKSPQQQNKSQPQQRLQQTWSPVVGGSVSSSSVRQENDTILRLPRSPDGTVGFQMHR